MKSLAREGDSDGGRGSRTSPRRRAVEAVGATAGSTAVVAGGEGQLRAHVFDPTADLGHVP